MKRWSLRLLVLGVLLTGARVFAVPASPFPIELKNADGSSFMGRLFGDEHLSWAHDLEGNPIAYDSLDGAWHYATLGPDGRFLALPYRVGSVDPARLNLARGLSPTLESKQQALALRAQSVQRSIQPVSPRGAIKNLTILVKYNCSTSAGGCASVNRNTTYTPAQYEPVLNGATNSVKAFYSEASYGQLQLTSTVAASQWVQLPNNDMYYVYNSDHLYDGHPEYLVRDAVQVLNQQQFNFRQFDSDNDGTIDAIHVIHVGTGYEDTGNSACIHSHYSRLASSVYTWDGIRIVAYHVEPELRASGAITQIGVITHETGHFFGLPDLYDYSDRSAGVGLWSLMAAGSWGGPNGDGTKPVHPDAWSKTKLGFTAPQEITATTNAVRLRPAYNTTDVVKVGAGMPYGQYFLLENRKQAGFDQYVPASGLAIYHVDENRWSDSCPDFNCNNNDPTHYLVDVEQPDGLRELNTSSSEIGDSGDVWPYGSRTSFSPTPPTTTPPTPNSLGYGQSSSTGKITISSIAKQSNGDITFNVQIAGSTPVLKPLGSACAAASECQSGFCADGVCCNTACNAGICDACSTTAGAPSNGTCVNTTVACNDNDLCTTNDRCEAGACHGTPVVCSETSCTQGGTCNPADGQCTGGSPKPNGTSCNDQNACTQTDACQNGTCVGANPVVCTDAACTTGGTCNPATGQCGGGSSKPNGTSCSDGNACTQTDACLNGQCVGSNPIQCSEDACTYGGTCDSATGSCVGGTPKANGTPCDDGDACTRTDSCQNGVCEGSNPPACVNALPPPCQQYLGCDWQTGQCLYKAAPAGSYCDDGNLCTVIDMCVGGQCVGSSPIECKAKGECRAAGECDPMTGICSNPEAEDGAECSDGICQSGKCVEPPAAAEESKEGCGCSAGASDPSSALFVLMAALGMLRRRFS